MGFARTLRRRLRRNAGKQVGRNYKQEMKLEQLEPRLLLSGDAPGMIYENISALSGYVEEFTNTEEENNAFDTDLPFMKMSKIIESNQDETRNEIVKPSIDDLLSYEDDIFESSENSGDDYINPFEYLDPDNGRISLAEDISDYISEELENLSEPETIEDIVSDINGFNDAFIYKNEDGVYEQYSTALEDESLELVFRSEWDAQDISSAGHNSMNLSYEFETNHDTVIDFGNNSLLDVPAFDYIKDEAASIYVDTGTSFKVDIDLGAFENTEAENEFFMNVNDMSADINAEVPEMGTLNIGFLGVSEVVDSDEYDEDGNKKEQDICIRAGINAELTNTEMSPVNLGYESDQIGYTVQGTNNRLTAEKSFDLTSSDTRFGVKLTSDNGRIVEFDIAETPSVDTLQDAVTNVNNTLGADLVRAEAYGERFSLVVDQTPEGAGFSAGDTVEAGDSFSSSALGDSPGDDIKFAVLYEDGGSDVVSVSAGLTWSDAASEISEQLEYAEVEYHSSLERLELTTEKGLEIAPQLNISINPVAGVEDTDGVFDFTQINGGVSGGTAISFDLEFKAEPLGLSFDFEKTYDHAFDFPFNAESGEFNYKDFIGDVFDEVAYFKEMGSLAFIEQIKTYARKISKLTEAPEFQEFRGLLTQESLFDALDLEQAITDTLLFHDGGNGPDSEADVVQNDSPALVKSDGNGGTEKNVNSIQSIDARLEELDSKENSAVDVLEKSVVSTHPVSSFVLEGEPAVFTLRTETNEEDTVTIDPASTSDNTGIDDLIDDINEALPERYTAEKLSGSEDGEWLIRIYTQDTENSEALSFTMGFEESSPVTDVFGFRSATSDSENGETKVKESSNIVYNHSARVFEFGKTELHIGEVLKKTDLEWEVPLQFAKELKSPVGAVESINIPESLAGISSNSSVTIKVDPVVSLTPGVDLSDKGALHESHILENLPVFQDHAGSVLEDTVFRELQFKPGFFSASNDFYSDENEEYYYPLSFSLDLKMESGEIETFDVTSEVKKSAKVSNITRYFDNGAHGVFTEIPRFEIKTVLEGYTEPRVVQVIAPEISNYNADFNSGENYQETFEDIHDGLITALESAIGPDGETVDLTSEENGNFSVDTEPVNENVTLLSDSQFVIQNSNLFEFEYTEEMLAKEILETGIKSAVNADGDVVNLKEEYGINTEDTIRVNGVKFFIHEDDNPGVAEIDISENPDATDVVRFIQDQIVNDQTVTSESSVSSTGVIKKDVKFTIKEFSESDDESDDQYEVSEVHNIELDASDTEDNHSISDLAQDLSSVLPAGYNALVEAGGGLVIARAADSDGGTLFSITEETESEGSLSSIGYTDSEWSRCSPGIELKGVMDGDGNLKDTYLFLIGSDQISITDHQNLDDLLSKVKDRYVINSDAEEDEVTVTYIEERGGDGGRILISTPDYESAELSPSQGFTEINKVASHTSTRKIPVGRLGGDAVFEIDFTDSSGDPYNVTIEASETHNNISIQNLVQDVQEAVDSALNGSGRKIAVDFQGQRLLFRNTADDETFTVTAANPEAQDLGLSQDGQTSNTDDLRIIFSDGTESDIDFGDVSDIEGIKNPDGISGRSEVSDVLKVLQQRPGEIENEEEEMVSKLEATVQGGSIKLIDNTFDSDSPESTPHRFRVVSLNSSGIASRLGIERLDAPEDKKEGKDTRNGEIIGGSIAGRMLEDRAFVRDLALPIHLSVDTNDMVLNEKTIDVLNDSVLYNPVKTEGYTTLRVSEDGAGEDVYENISESLIGQSVRHAEADYRVTDYYRAEDGGTEYKHLALNGIVRGSDNAVLSSSGSFDAEAWDNSVSMDVVNPSEGSSDYIPAGTYIHEGPFSTFSLESNPNNVVSGFSQGDLLEINGNQHEILDVSTKLFTGEKTLKLSGVVMDSEGNPLGSEDELVEVEYKDQVITIKPKEIGYVEAETRVRVSTKTTQFVVSEPMEDEFSDVYEAYNNMGEMGIAKLSVAGNEYRILAIEEVDEQFNNRDIDNDENQNQNNSQDFLVVVEGVVVDDEGDELSENRIIKGDETEFTLKIGSNPDKEFTYEGSDERLYTASVDHAEDLEERLGSIILDNYLKINGNRYKVTKTESDSSGVVLTLSGRVTDGSGDPITGGVSVNDILHEGVQASANLGPIGVDVIGNGSFNATLNSLESRGKYTVGDIIEHARHLSLFRDMFNIGETNFELSGNYDFEIIPEGFGSNAITKAEGEESAVFKVSDFSLSPLGELDFTAGFENLKETISDLLDTGFSSDSIAETISDVLSNLKDIAGEELFNKNLPVINKSINDIVGIVDEVVSTIRDFSENPGETLQELNDMLKEKLGVKNDMVTIYFEEVPSEPSTAEDGETDTIMKFEIDYMKYFEEAVGLDFGKDLGFNFPGMEDEGEDNISGAADLSVSGQIGLNVDFGINLSDRSVSIYDTTTVEVSDFAIEGKDLEFQLVAGGVGITVQPVSNRDSYITFNNANASIFLEEDYLIDPFTDESSEDEEDDNSINLGTSFSGYIGGELPVFFPTDTRYVGSLRLGTWDDNGTPDDNSDDFLSVSPQGGGDEGKGLIEDFQQFAEFKVWKGEDSDNENGDYTGAAFGPDETYPTEDLDGDGENTGISDDLVLDVRDFSSGINFSMDNLDLFKKLELAVDGLDIFLAAIEANVDFSKFSDTPVIGDAMLNMNGFLDGFRYDFLGKFREFVFEGGDLTAKSVGNFLFNILGPDGFEGFDGLDLLPDLSGLDLNAWGNGLELPELNGEWGNDWNGFELDGFPGVRFTTNITKGAEYSDQYAEWLFTVGDSYSLGTDLGFDIGVPGFSLESRGNLSLNLDWALNLGLGISASEGFYLIIPEGDELQASVSVEITNDSGNEVFNGSLAFLEMKAEKISGKEALEGSVDLNVNLNGTRENPDSDEEGMTHENVDKLGLSELGVLSFEESSLGVHLNSNLALTLGILSDVSDNDNPSFPNITADFTFDYEIGNLFDGYQDDTEGIQEISLENIEFGLGQYISDVIKPVVDEILDIVDPMMPLIEFLTTPFPVLDDIGMEITPLDLAAAMSGDRFDPGMVYALANTLQFADTLSDFDSDDISIGLGHYYVKKLIKDGDGNVEGTVQGWFLEKPESVGLSTAEAEPIDTDDPEKQNKMKDEIKENEGGLDSDIVDFLLGRTDSDWTLPIIQDPSQIIGLITGGDATLIHYDMPKLSFMFNWDQFINIVGPIGANIGVEFGVEIDLGFGYDTYGIRRFIESDYRNPGLLASGFFISDLKDGKDIDEVVFTGGVSAAVGVNLGFAKAGVGGGVKLDIGFDFYDPDRDGKIRFTEMAESFINEWEYGSKVLAPLAVFDVHGEIYAELFAFLELKAFKKRWDWQITNPITIASFDVDFYRAPKLATVQGDDLIIHAGDFAGDRLNGNVSDGDEHFNINVKSNKIVVSSPSHGGVSQAYDKVGKIVIKGGKGDDRFSIKGDGSVDIDASGGIGDDYFDLSGYSTGGASVVVHGDEGDDTIIGSQGADRLYGDTGNDTINGKGGRDFIFGDDAMLRGSAAMALAGGTKSGRDKLLGGDGSDFIFGGGGNDTIAGMGGNDYIFGDSARIDFKSSIVDDAGRLVDDIPEIDRISRTRTGNDADDVIAGNSGDDRIYAGGGDDIIDGGAGSDRIYASAGDDLACGGSGDDMIEAGEGRDIVFGSRILEDSYDLSEAFAELSDSGHIYLVDISDLSGNSVMDDTGSLDSDDEIYGGRGDDIIFGDTGSTGIGGSDEIYGGQGNDLIDGGAGNDTLYGGLGGDTIFGGSDDDIIYSGQGADIVFGDRGHRDFLDDTTMQYTGGYEGEFAGDAGDSVNQDFDVRWRPQVYGYNTGAQSYGYMFQTPSHAVDNDNPDVYTKSISDGGDDVIYAGNGSDLVDGQGGNDKYHIGFKGGQNSAFINVSDSGVVSDDDGSGISDTLNVTGTDEDDEILMRTSKDGLGLIASINDRTYNLYERINYWNDNGLGVDSLVMDAGAGDDYIAVDDSAMSMDIYGGTGNDEFQVGQLYNSARENYLPEENNVYPEDLFPTVPTTLGHLSYGISESANIYGGFGDDEFTVYRNLAELSLFGEAGDDHFLVKAFAIEGSYDDTSRGDTNIDTGTGYNHVEYAVNATVNISGGPGFDTVEIIGTEFSDNIVINEDGVFGAGLNVNYSEIEVLAVDAAEGDDTFQILGTDSRVVTQVFGGLGNDTVNIGGNGEENIVVTKDMRGHNGLISHSVEAEGTNYEGVKIRDISTNIIDNDSDRPKLLFNRDGESGVYGRNEMDIIEGGEYREYSVSLSHFPATEDGKVRIVATAPGLSTEDAKKGKKGVLLSTDPESGEWSETVSFDYNGESEWDGTPEKIYVKAPEDGVYEGRKEMYIKHKIVIGASSGEASEGDSLAEAGSMKAVVHDADAPGVIIERPDNLEISENGDTEEMSIRLSRRPDEGETVTVSFTDDSEGRVEYYNSDDEQIESLTFDRTDWDNEKIVRIQAADDSEGQGMTTAEISVITESDKEDAEILEGKMTSVKEHNLGGDREISIDDEHLGEIEIISVTDDQGDAVEYEFNGRTLEIDDSVESDTVKLEYAYSNISLKEKSVITLDQAPAEGDDDTHQIDVIDSTEEEGMLLEEGSDYIVEGNQVIFIDDEGKSELQNGEFRVSYSYRIPGYNDLYEQRMRVDVHDNDRPEIRLVETDGSTDLIEGGSDLGRVDEYSVVLNKAPEDGDVTVRISPEDTIYDKVDGEYLRAEQVELSSDVGEQEDDGSLVFTFTAEEDPDDGRIYWEDSPVVKVSAIDDDDVEKDEYMTVPKMDQTLNNIKGTLYAEGAGGSGSVVYSEPLMFPYEKNSFTSTDHVSDISSDGKTVTVNKDAILEAAADLYEDLDEVEVEDLVDLTLTVTNGVERIGQFALITEAEEVDDNKVELRLNEAWELEYGIEYDELQLKDDDPDNDFYLEYKLTRMSLNFFVDERSQVDRLFVNNQDSELATQGGYQDRLEEFFKEGVWHPDTDQAEIVSSNNTLASELIASTDAMHISGLGTASSHDIDGVTDPGGINYGDFELVEMNLGSNSDEFDINAAAGRTDGFRTWTILNTGDGDDVVNVNSHSLENIEEVSSGEIIGVESSDIGSVLSVDWEVSNQSGIWDGYYVEIQKGEDYSMRVGVDSVIQSDDDSNPRIQLDREIEGSVLGKTLTLIKAVEYETTAENTEEVIGEHSIVLGYADEAESNEDAIGRKISLFVVMTDGSTRRIDRIITGIDQETGEVFVNSEWKFDFQNERVDTQEDIGVHIYKNRTDGELAVNTQQGDDELDADNDEVTKSLILFGGLGNDVIEADSDNYIFGDRGMVKYINENGAVPEIHTDEEKEIVTLLGPDNATQDTLNGFQTDGVRRDPVLLTTIDNELGGDDKITVSGSNNIIFGGYNEGESEEEGEVITVEQEEGDNAIKSNIVIGDGGKIEQANIRNNEDLVWGDTSPARIVTIKTIDNETGGIDYIDTGNGDDIVMGGASGDEINTVEGDDVVFGDGAEVFYNGEGGFAFIRTISDEIGGADIINAGEGDDVVMGGASGDEINTVEGDDVVFGDGAEVVYNGEGGFAFIMTISDEIGGADIINAGEGDNVVMGGYENDQITAGSGDDAIVGDGGIIHYHSSGDIACLNTNAEDIGGDDTIHAGDGDNVVMGGFGADSITALTGDDIIFGDNALIYSGYDGEWVEARSRSLHIGSGDVIDAGIGSNTVVGGLGDDYITAGHNNTEDVPSDDIRDDFSDDRDYVAGDNGRRTFNGSGEFIDVPETSAVSFNFSGTSQYEMGDDERAGVWIEDISEKASKWNQIDTQGPAVIGNDPEEFVYTNHGEKIDGVTLQYGASEDVRADFIRLHEDRLYNNGIPGEVTSDKKMYSGNLRTSESDTANNLGVRLRMEGLNNHYESYDVYVYLDANDNVSGGSDSESDTSIRRVSVDSETVDNDTFYVNDVDGHTFDGGYQLAAATSEEDASAANYVKFTGLTENEFNVMIKDPYAAESGQNLPSIAGVQIVGRSHPVDVFESKVPVLPEDPEDPEMEPADVLGGNDIISTSGGDDVVMGGTGQDTIATFGDIRQGINDSDIVFGDDGFVTEKLGEPVFAKSVMPDNTLFTEGYNNDIIVTGNGNDTVIGGYGSDLIDSQRHDTIDSIIYDEIEAMDNEDRPEVFKSENYDSVKDMEYNNLEVMSINFARDAYEVHQRDAEVAQGEYAGAVAADNWNNLWRDNTSGPELTFTGLMNNSGVVNNEMSVTIRKNNSSNQRPVSDEHDQIDPGSANSNMFNSYLNGEQQDSIQVELRDVLAGTDYDSYDVYVYIDGDNEKTAISEFAFELAGGDPSDMSGAQKYYVEDWEGAHFAGEYRNVQAEDADPDEESALNEHRERTGNYVVFKDVTSENFMVSLQNYFYGDQNVQSQPTIAGLQVVYGEDKDNLTLSGDYDRDVIAGDNGEAVFHKGSKYLGLTADDTGSPFTSVEKQNMVTRFESYEIDGGNASDSDYIISGINRDNVLGGNGPDVIDSGAGNDTAAGDNAELHLYKYDAVNTRSPSVYNYMNNDDNAQENSPDPIPYVGEWGFDAYHVLGVDLKSSDFGGNDIIDAGADNDLVYGQEGSTDLLVENEGEGDVSADTGNDEEYVVESEEEMTNDEMNDPDDTADDGYESSDDYLDDLSGILADLQESSYDPLSELVANDFEGTDRAAVKQEIEDRVESGGGGGVDTITINGAGSEKATVDLSAGDTIIVESETWPGYDNEYWNPDVKMILENNGTEIPELMITVNGSSYDYAGGGWYHEIDIPDVGPYEMVITAVEDSTFKVGLG